MRSFPFSPLVTICGMQRYISVLFLVPDRGLGARLNVNGGSLAIGHPFAATGGRCVTPTAPADTFPYRSFTATLSGQLCDTHGTDVI